MTQDALTVEWITEALNAGRAPVITVTVQEAARLLGISRNAAYAAVKRGQIPSIRIGRKLLVPTQQLVDLLDGRGEA